MNYSRSLFIFTLSSLIAGTCPAYSNSTFVAQTNVNPKATSTAPGHFDPEEAQGSLHEMAKTSRKIKKNTAILAYELSRRAWIHALSPNVIGIQAGEVIQPFPPPEGYVRGGPLPPRPGMMDAILASLKKFIVHMRTLERKMNFPPALQEQLASRWSRVTATVDDMVNHHNHMVACRTGDKAQIASDVVAIFDDAKNLRKPLNDVASTVEEYEDNLQVAANTQNLR